jgi:hypothetical protein
VQSPVLHALTLLAFALHIGGGAVGLVSGTVAVFAHKGGRFYRSTWPWDWLRCSEAPSPSRVRF